MSIVYSSVKRLALLKDAWKLSFHVQSAARMENGISVLPIDSRPGTAIAASALNLDRTDLQFRIIEATADVNLSAAEHLLTEAAIPKLPMLSCSQALAYDLRRYYPTVTNIIHRSNATLDWKESEIIADVENIQTHTQIPWMMIFIEKVSVNPVLMENISAVLLRQMSKLSGKDPRGFVSEMESPLLIEVSHHLYKSLEHNSPHAGTLLLQAIKAYLIENYNAIGCNDDIAALRSIRADNHVGWQKLPTPLLMFNQTFADQLRNMHISPIVSGDIHSNELLRQNVTIEEYWKDPQGKRLLGELRYLRFGSGRIELSAMARATPSWRAGAISLLSQIDDWRGEGQDSFHEKEKLFESLIDLVQDDHLKWEIVQKDLDLISSSPLQYTNPAEWLLCLHALKWRIVFGSEGEINDKQMELFAGRLERSENKSLYLIGALRSRFNIDVIP